MNSTNPVPAQTHLYFDQDITLGELLKVVSREHLANVLSALLGPAWRLLSPQGETILGTGDSTTPNLVRAPFRLELEPIGYLETVHDEHLAAAVEMMEMMALTAARYFMAAAIQMESVQQDFAELQDKNSQLQASEERYRALATGLEQRVAEQVKTIESTQRQLYQTEKLASVGQLAAGVAHEINNPLGFVSSNMHTASDYVKRFSRLGGLLRSNVDAKLLVAAWQQEQLDTVLDDFPALLQECNDGVARVAKIVSALKDFSSVNQTEKTDANINALLETTCQVAASQFGESIRLVTEYGELPSIQCHAGRLSQAFMNLLLNATQAIKGPGEVRITTASDGKNVSVSIADTGCGIPDNVQDRIFDPFFTTRDIGQGTGLGLAVTRDVVQAHGGQIAVQSRPGAGTTFVVTIPLKHHD